MCLLAIALQRKRRARPRIAQLAFAADTEFLRFLASEKNIRAEAFSWFELGTGDKANPKPDGTGKLYIDDIHITK